MLRDQLSSNEHLLWYGQPQEFDYLGRHWAVNAPLGITREQLYKWAYYADRMVLYD